MSQGEFQELFDSRLEEDEKALFMENEDRHFSTYGNSAYDRGRIPSPGDRVGLCEIEEAEEVEQECTTQAECPVGEACVEGQCI